MEMQHEINIQNVFTQQLNDEYLNNLQLKLNVLRLDAIHDVVSGNKWFKLKYFLKAFTAHGYKSIVTFGGAYSNHILATAYLCNKENILCKGYIRGEEPLQYSQTLLDAKALNMQLEFLSREDYANRQIIMRSNAATLFIPEGGYGATGAKGAAEIMQLAPNLSLYNYIVCAAGTGTMLAGIANASMPHQQCIGISVMKNNFSLANELLLLVDGKAANRVKLIHDYHFGGYAKYTSSLIDFMNKTWTKHYLPLDFVYTAKALYAVYHLAEKSYFKAGSQILFIHSGGLQGNSSLPEELLLY